MADVADDSASRLFANEKNGFGGHEHYEIMCADKMTLINAMKALNGEIAPAILRNKLPANIPDRDE